jgi:undecaprenyl-diphosphatase
LSRVSGDQTGNNRNPRASEPSSSAFLARGNEHAERRGPISPPLVWPVAGILLLVAGTLLGVAAAGGGTLPGDVLLTRAVQQPASSALDRAAWVMSRLGDHFPQMTVLALALVALLLWRNHIGPAAFIAAAAVSRAINPVLKSLFSSARPIAPDIAIIDLADGFGYPSGHAFGAALVYGAILVIAPSIVRNSALARIIQAAVAAMIVLMALARVRLGVHWPSDVAGGVLFGLGIVCVLKAVLDWLNPWWRLRT